MILGMKPFEKNEGKGNQSVENAGVAFGKGANERNLIK